MTSVRPMGVDDLLHFNTCNLDQMTETYHLRFYLEYFRRWPELCRVVVDFPNFSAKNKVKKERIIGYGE